MSENTNIRKDSNKCEDKECKFCGIQFKQKRIDQIYCSKKCAHADWQSSHSKSDVELMRQGNNHITFKGINDRLQSKFPNFEYVKGYKSIDQKFTIRCKKCGYEFERSALCLKPSRPNASIKCKHCEELLKTSLNYMKQEFDRYDVENKANESEIKEYSKIKMHKCPTCGKIFYTKENRKYCSNECSKKVPWRNKDAYRHDFPLEEVFNKSNGICHICGKQCDWNDTYYNDDGFLIYGNMYPSRDHVKPKSKGGENSWDNIKLAHRICNSLKGDLCYE